MKSEFMFLVFEDLDVEVKVWFNKENLAYSSYIEKFEIVYASTCLNNVTDIFADFLESNAVLNSRFKSAIIEVKKAEERRKRKVQIPEVIENEWVKFSVKIYDLDIEGYFLAEGSYIKKYVFSSVNGCSDMLYVDFIENYIHSIPKKEKEFLEVLEKHKNNNSNKFMDIQRQVTHLLTSVNNLCQELNESACKGQNT